MAYDLRFLVPLAGLEPATCCLGDDCQSSAESVPVGSRQVRLARDSAQFGLVGCSMSSWNDRQHDHLTNQEAQARERCIDNPGPGQSTELVHQPITGHLTPTGWRTIP